MKKASRILSVILCLGLIMSAFVGCNIKITVDVNKTGGAAPVVSPVTSQTPATTAPTTTSAPVTTSAPADDTTAAPTEAPKPAEDTTKAPETTAPTAASELSASSSVADIVAEYAKVYNTTKATGTFTGYDTMELTSVQIDGKENSLVKNAAAGVVKADAKGFQLPPFSDDNPSKECLITADDVKEATYKDNGDGTATIVITPKPATNSKKFQDSQGKMFNVMEDVAGALAGISLITWAEGDANSNVVLTCDGSYAEVTYDKATKMMTKAEYVLITVADVKHANVLFLKDKNATATFKYIHHFPEA